MSSILLTMLLVLPAAPEAPARPAYHLRIVLHVAPHRSLTPLFQEQLRRELGDQVRLALGAIAQVEVVRQHDLLGAIEARGLRQALDGWDRLDDHQTHFVLLRYRGGGYELETGSHDGATGQAGPLLRQAATFERGDVAALAARLVEKDFAPWGNVVAAGKDAKLTLPGGDPASLGRWVKPGDVFAVSRIATEGARRRATRIPWALLQVSDAPTSGGMCRCTYWHRFQGDELRDVPGIVYRAVKLPTTEAHLHLRLIEDETLRPVEGAGLTIQVSHPGAKKQETLAPQNGLAVTRDTYRNLALVQVGSGAGALARFPIAILDERTVDCRIKIRPDAEALAALENRRALWLRRLYEGLGFSNFVAQRLKERLNQSLAAALQEGQQGLKSLAHEIQELASEHDELQGQLRSIKQVRGLDLGEGAEALKELRQRHQLLHDFVARVEQQIKEAASEKTQKLHKLLEQARLLEAEADFDRAIAIYDEVLTVTADQPKIRAHRERLKKRWEAKSDEHRKARQFIYETWPALDVPGLRENLPRAREALHICQEAKDSLSPLKLQRANALHTAHLQRQREMLSRQEGDDANNQRRALAQLAEDFRQFHAAVTAATKE